MDDENLINWDLKNHKRFKTRKELNSLLKDKNKVKYKTRSSIQLFKKPSSSEDEEFFFSGNKSRIRNRKKKYIYKIFQKTCFFSLPIVCLIINLILIILNLKYKNEINILKEEHRIIIEKNPFNMSDLLTLQNNYNSILKKLKKYDEAFGIDSYQNSNESLIKNYFLEEILKNIKLVEKLDDLNKTIEYKIDNYFKNSTLAFQIDDIKQTINNQIDNDFYTKDLQEIRNLILNLSNNLYDTKNTEDSIKQKIITDIGNKYLNTIIKRLDSCNCQINSST